MATTIGKSKRCMLTKMKWTYFTMALIQSLTQTIRGQFTKVQIACAINVITSKKLNWTRFQVFSQKMK
jgi:hypothetical protein